MGSLLGDDLANAGVSWVHDPALPLEEDRVVGGGLLWAPGRVRVLAFQIPLCEREFVM